MDGYLTVEEPFKTYFNVDRFIVSLRVSILSNHEDGAKTPSGRGEEIIVNLRGPGKT